MKALTFAGLAGLASLGCHAQLPIPIPRYFEPVVVTATRGLVDGPATLRDAVVITREDLEASTGLSLAEVLQRFAGAEFRSTGGPGQPTGVFLRGAGAAQTLVLIDGLRAGSATAGTTAVEAIPLEMIERVEVVKGPMSSLYGSDAIGGVVQVFTRGRSVPHLFVASAYGSENDRRASAGLSTAEGGTVVSIAAGARKVDARSATNERVPFGVHDPDRDPHENAFVTMSASQRMWTGETLALEAFASRSRTAFDGGDPTDRTDQSVGGARFTSSAAFAQWWSSRFTLGHTRDRLRLLGPFPALFETRQDQASWINDFRTGAGSMLLGAEIVRQKVLPDAASSGPAPFSTTQRETRSVFAALNESWQGQRFEASVRRDDDEQFGARSTGSTSYGASLTEGILVSATLARGFRAPTFNDLYLVAYKPFYTPNPALRPERSSSREIALRSAKAGPFQWRITAFDSRLEDLIVATAATVMNVSRAHVRGVEAAADLTWLGIRWRAAVTAQRPRDEDTGTRLQGRALRYGSFEASRTRGAWTVSTQVTASGDRYDSLGEASGTRLAAYARADARVRYAIDKRWAVELTAVNLTDKRYERALGYDGARRGALLSVRFDAF
ncbi:MAG TPA: TonB-dependent receptor [Usitatibacter sp.]|nr:TonB-dependent receptor [Usitatibacter sp.]